MHKDGIELLAAAKRRKESEQQHLMLQNRISHLEHSHQREHLKMQQIQLQMSKINSIRNIKSEVMMRRNEQLEKSKEEQESKK